MSLPFDPRANVIIDITLDEYRSLRADAIRYRWLVSCNDAAVWSFLSGMDDDQIDEAIDTWLAEEAVGAISYTGGSGDAMKRPPGPEDTFISLPIDVYDAFPNDDPKAD